MNESGEIRLLTYCWLKYDVFVDLFDGKGAILVVLPKPGMRRELTWEIVRGEQSLQIDPTDFSYNTEQLYHRRDF
jgi:hypothetical protein